MHEGSVSQKAISGMTLWFKLISAIWCVDNDTFWRR